MASLCLPTAKVGEGLVVLRDLIGQSSVSMKMNQWTAQGLFRLAHWPKSASAYGGKSPVRQIISPGLTSVHLGM